MVHRRKHGTKIIHSAELAKLGDVSRATIYRYAELGLLSPGRTDDRGLTFDESSVDIVRLIQRLKEKPFRYSLSQIRDDVCSKFPLRALIVMANLPVDQIQVCLNAAVSKNPGAQPCIWEDKKNERRGILIDKKFNETISSDEQDELDQLNEALDQYLDEIGPLPTEHSETL
ncbi:MerR family transcriptional regulator [Candidatus Entotheonella palauensis]|uniref:HTH merR-type domain-containing protein n=1 Tax=Candidatus Entotheonella gemina TaxID=1429439 RepID=W4MD82_9BACT|nr:MerR family transcriptional regulator [Candidatus Entotheonella palauensis]ETX07881.1 MAG: hypothetical protein ETSY2_08595 [Candidatus Entotheonella gemina]